MAVRAREEIVGKRFLSVSSPGKLKLAKIGDWEWRAGVIRAASHKDPRQPELTVLVEFDDVEWKRREWIRVYEDNIFQVFLVEHTLVWAPRRDPFSPKHHSIFWPALNFKPLVDKVGLNEYRIKPLEFLVDKAYDYRDYTELKVYQDADDVNQPAPQDYPEVRKAIKKWTECQDGQRILLTTPSVLVGYRVEVYRAEGTTQWYTAVIVSYNDNIRDLTVVDDTVLEEHNEDPCLVQMRLIGDGVVESILRGENIGITPRRRTCTLNNQNLGHYTRTRSQNQNQSHPAPRLLAQASAKKGRPRAAGASDSTTAATSTTTTTATATTTTTTTTSSAVVLTSSTSSSSNTSSSSVVSASASSLTQKSVSASTAALSATSPQRTSVEKDKAEKNGRPNRDRKRKTSASDPKSPSGTPLQSECVPVTREKSPGKKAKPQELDICATHELLQPRESSSETKERSVSRKKVSDHSQHQVNSVTDHKPDHNVKESKRTLSLITTGKCKRSKVQAAKTGGSGNSEVLVAPVTASSEKDSSASASSADIHETDKRLNKVSSSEPECSSVSTVLTISDTPVVLPTVSNTCLPTEISAQSHPACHTTQLEQLDSKSSCGVSCEPLVKENSPPVAVASPDVPLPQSITTQQQQQQPAVLHADPTNTTDKQCRIPDDRSDSGISEKSVIRSEGSRSGDERSASRSSESSRISSWDEQSSEVKGPQPPPTVTTSQVTLQSRKTTTHPPPTTKASPSNSPLVFDKSEPVRVWRDPKLVHSDTTVRHVHSIQHTLMAHPSGVSHASTVYAGIPASASLVAAASNHPSSLPPHARPTMGLPAHYPPHLTSHVLAAANSPHEQHPMHLSSTSNVPTQTSYSPLIAQHAAAHLVPQYGAGLPMDMMWQQKYPTMSVPAQWMQMSYQEDQLVERERARLDRERRDQAERERDRMEREKEKERHDREKLEKERLERSRVEREKLERERMDQAHAQAQAQAQAQAHAQAQAQAHAQERVERAVHQHFEESLRLASKKKGSSLSGWSHITSLPPKGSGSLQEAHASAAAIVQAVKAEQERREAEQPMALDTKEHSKERQHLRYAAIDEEKRRHEQEKWILQQQHLQQQQQHAAYAYANSEVLSRASNSARIKGECPPPPSSHGYNYSGSSSNSSGSSKPNTPSRTSSPAQLPKAEQPSFNLYGYQPFQHSYISQDKLAGQGKSGSAINQDPHKTPITVSVTQTLAPTGSAGGRRAVLPSPPPLLSSGQEHERKAVIVNHDSSRGGTPIPPAHSLSPKQQMKLVQQHQQQQQQHYQDQNGPLYAVGAQATAPAFKPYDYARSPTPSLSPHLRGGGTPQHHTPSPRPAPSPHAAPSPHHLVSEQTNLPKAYLNQQGSPSATYSSATVSVTTSTYSSHVYTSASVTSGPTHFATTTTSHGQSSAKSSPSLPHNLIQQGLVPNPMYSGLTAAPNKSSSHPKPGIMSGLPLTRMPTSGGGVSSSGIPLTTPPPAHFGKVELPSRSSQLSPNQHPSHHSLHAVEHSAVGSANDPLSFTTGRTVSLGPQLQTVRDRGAPVRSHSPASRTGPGSSPVPSGNPSKLPSAHQPTHQYTGNPFAGMPVQVASPPGIQTQPLNLQNPDRQRDAVASPTNLTKRKSPKEGSSRKRPKTSDAASPGTQVVSSMPPSPVLARVSAPSPLMANAATTITAVVNTAAFGGTVGTQVVAQSSMGSTATSVTTTTCTATTTTSGTSGICSPKDRTGFLDSFVSFVKTSAQKQDFEPFKPKGKQKGRPPKGATSSPTAVTSAVPNTSPTSAAPTSTPSSSSGSSAVMSEPDKSVSPALVTSSSGNAHPKLKKAWLQRHSGEDKKDSPVLRDTSTPTPVVTTPAKASTPVPQPPTRDTKVSGTTSTTSPTSTTIINGHTGDSSTVPIHDESTNSASETEVETNVVKRKVKAPRKPPVKDNKRGKKAVVEQTNDVIMEDVQEEKVKEEPIFEIKSEAPAPPPPQHKKRGRKPKPKPEKEEVPKKAKPSSSSEKPSISRLKRSGESFLQNGSCCDVAPKLSKCRECRMTKKDKKMPNIFCRFYDFRRLRFSKNGFMANAGFSEPKDATEDDLKLWLPQDSNPPSDLDLDTSKFVLSHVGNQFCDLVEQEREAQSLHLADDKTIAWKRVVQGVREMCDVCETTLFNIHWACSKCGFVVCIDCYKAKKNGTSKSTQNEDENPAKDRDKYWWLLCNNRQPHEQDKLMLTQIIADDSLYEVGKQLHEVRKRWNIAMHCSCIRQNAEKEKKPSSNGLCKQLMSAVSKCITPDGKKSDMVNGVTESTKSHRKGSKSLNGAVTHVKSEDDSGSYSPDTGSPLCWLADVALNESSKMSPKAEVKSEPADSPDEGKGEHFSTLRELLIRPTGKNVNSSKNSNNNNNHRQGPKKQLNTLDDVINCMIEQSVDKQEERPSTREEKRLMHYMRRYPQPRSGWDPLPVRIFTLAESKLLFPNVPHAWLCEGRLLRLLDPVHANNIRLFQEQWKRGQPVLVSEVSKALDMSLWHPTAFARDFGDIKNDLVNCHTGNIVPNQPMRKFWDGFENFSKRMKDDNGEYMLLKLKDWPPGDDFSELLPSRFQDLMKCLPMPEYTHRNGKLNLAGRLPDCFVRPDLGPKMYNAYGSALYPSKGTTNLHLDISDAVNVMVYVGIPKDGNDEQHIQEALRAIDEAGCDILTRRRVREKGERPGALWHIYNARDADKIRDLLNKVAIERGEKLEPHHDPIHDQSWYLNRKLRERLYQEYGVEGYAIAQCLGDAVFIPAGAPHQVRNLHSCIKVAEDFVSPENVSHCFTLTQEFRDLSDTHTNHEDKLQVKNIIYHAIKDALSVILANELDSRDSKS